MNEAFATITATVIQFMLFAIFALVVGNLVAPRLAKTKTGREVASKLIILGLISAFVMLFLLPRLSRQ